MQRLWLCKLEWDESLPSDLDTKWRNFRNQLNDLNHLKIPRYLFCENFVSIEIHGFSDAALGAYGACCYARCEDTYGNVTVQLLCSKTRVFPLKTTTIPRLELCAALVLANLMQKVKNALTVNVEKIVLWCDSTVCLSWIRTPPNLLQVFVGNRVSQIQNFTKPEQWNYVKSADNPADLLSRGLNPELIETCALWWNGPQWLSQSKDKWPLRKFKSDGNIPELKKQTTILNTVVQ
nr:unnamed protein product [Callosobruchus analis]